MVNKDNKQGIENFGLDTSMDYEVAESQELEELLRDCDGGTFEEMAWYLINPESSFSQFQNIQVQLVTWCTLILTPLLLVFKDDYPEIGSGLLFVEWIVDISWTIEICLNFITADKNSTTFMAIAKNYLSFWFWFDALATFPAMYFLQDNTGALMLKMLRLLHLFDIFSPLKLLLERVLMRNSITKEIDNMFKLCILFSATILFAHILACIWLELGLHTEEGMMKGLIESDDPGDLMWREYGPFALYVFSLYWIFEVLTTVGYGDYTGSSEVEMLFSILLEFGGLVLFAFLTGLLVELVSIGGDFNDMLSEYIEKVNIWVMKLEKANDNKRNVFMPSTMYRNISVYTEEAFKHDFNLIIEQAEFYQQLKP